MENRFLFARKFARCLGLPLAVLMALAPSAAVLGQTNAAQQAVRQRVDQYGPYQSTTIDSNGVPPSDRATPYGDAGIPRIDANFISPGASAVLVIRPAQLFAAPNGEMLPKEVAAAAGLQYLGFDPAEVEEIVSFVDMSDPAMPAYGVTTKFMNPFRAASIPLERRAHAQLAELGGKKYLQSTLPPLYSLYGPNNKTLVLSPDATLRQLVQSIGQPKTGPLIDRVQSAPAGSDLYLAFDVATLRPFIQMGMAQAAANVPEDAKPLLEAPNLIAAVEFTLNISNDGPISLVVHANDEAAAQQLETLLLELKAKSQAAAEPTMPDDPIQQAMTQYIERMSRPFTPQRNGAAITLIHIDSQNPAQKQLASSIITGVCAMAVPAIQAARQTAEMAPAFEEPGADPESPEQIPPTEQAH